MKKELANAAKDELSKNAKYLFCALYKHYIARVEDNTLREIAKSFGSSEQIQKDLLPQWSEETIVETCRELGKDKYIICFYSNGVVRECFLTDSAIAYMEKRFKSNLAEITEYMKNI